MIEINQPFWKGKPINQNMEKWELIEIIEYFVKRVKELEESNARWRGLYRGQPRGEQNDWS